jgi:hypothetical protein
VVSSLVGPCQTESDLNTYDDVLDNMVGSAAGTG